MKNAAADNDRVRLWSLTRRFLSDLAEYAGPAGFLVCVFVALAVLLEGVGLVLLLPVLGVVTGSNAGGVIQRAATVLFRLFGAESQIARLILLLGMIVVLSLIRAAVISARDVTLARLEIGFVQSLQARIVSLLGAARWEQVSRLRHARISHLMSGDIQRIGGGVHVFLQAGVAVVMLAGQCLLAVALSPSVAAISFLLLACSAVALVPLWRRARMLGGIVTDSNLALMNSATQFLGGLKLAVSQDLQSSFVSEFNATLKNLGHQEIRFVQQYSKSRLAVTTAGTIVGAVAILIGFAVLGTAPPVLLTLLVIMSRMSGPAVTAQSGIQEFVRSLPAYDKVKELEEELRQTDSTVMDAPLLTIPEAPIVFRNVSYRHALTETAGAGEDQLRHLDLTIMPGSFIGITGPSGAGKTTFADLLVGLFPSSSGEIRIGSVVLSGSVVPSWRRQIAYVSQDQFLFHDTVRRNILWTNPNATERDLLLAIQAAGADTIIDRMPQGLDTIVGERGTLVSGGERQRIAIARALIRKPRLLVLDEATNAIDAAGEREIIERIFKLCPGLTIVMIAHRGESLSLCDRVLIFESGKLRADGQFASLESQLRVR